MTDKLTEKQKVGIAERLTLARVRKLGDVARAEAARLLREPPSTYAQYETAIRQPTIATALRLTRRLGVTLDWLLAGVGSPDGDSAGTIDVPVLSFVSAGELLREDIADEALGSITVADLPDGDWIALKVSGDSMDRISPPESVILVNRRDKRLVANACYVIDDGEGRATYKRYRPNPMRFEPVSTNPEHEPLFPDSESHEPTIVGRVYETILRL